MPAKPQRARPRLYRWGHWTGTPPEVFPLHDRLRVTIRWAHRVRGSLVMGQRIIFDHELIVIVSGSGMLHRDGCAAVELKPGSTAVIEPYAPHRIEPLSGEAAEHIAVHCDPRDGLPGSLPEMPLLPYRVDPGRERTWSTVAQLDPQGAEMRDLLRIPTLFAHGGLSLCVAESLVTVALAGILEATPPRIPSRLAPAMHLLCSDPGAAHQRASLAKACALSPSRFAAIFRAWRGHGPLVELRHQRMRLADALLRSNNIGIEAVARRCGYADTAYFVRIYRQHFGHPPHADR